MNVTGLIKQAWTVAKDPPLWRAALPEDRPQRDYEDINKVNMAMLPLLALALVAAAWAGTRSCSSGCAIGPVLLWCVACLAVGGTVGFLFGIPKSDATQRASQREASARANGAEGGTRATDTDAPGGAKPNTNLEEVSDWLTKILVGLSLVHLNKIERRVMLISENAAATLNVRPTATDISIATALVVGFAVIGFLFGYLYTRLFLQGAFSRSDGEMRKRMFQRVVADVLSKATPDDVQKSGEPSLPSASDRLAAERVLKATPAERPEDVLKPLRALAEQYEQVRKDMEVSDERTSRMSEIANGMKRLALAAAPFLSQLAQSTSPGERLAAIVILQMRFDPSYVDWLAERLVEEPAFPAYQAASALLARCRVVSGSEREHIKAAVQAAKDKRRQMNLPAEAQRDKLIERILSS